MLMQTIINVYLQLDNHRNQLIQVSKYKRKLKIKKCFFSSSYFDAYEKTLRIFAVRAYVKRWNRLCNSVFYDRRNIRREHSLHMEPRPWIPFQMGKSHISVSRRKIT